MPLDGVHRGLRYLPSIEDDLLPRTAQTKTLEVELLKTTMGRWRKLDGKYSLYLHGNCEVKVSEDGKDMSPQLGIQRWIRRWHAPLKGATPEIRTANHRMEETWKQPHGFGSDSGASTSWIDAPGHVQEKAERTSSRNLQEFITGIIDPRRGGRLLPDYGGLHYWVAVDMSPEDYRVIMSMPKRLTPGQIERAMGGPSKAFPVEVIMASKPPDPADWQFISHDWQNYTKYLN